MVVQELRQVHEAGLANSLAWVVMPDHVHWLLELKTDSLSRLVARVKAKSAIRINKALQRQGPLWQDGFHDRALRKEEDLVGFARYIVANPVRAGLVRSIRQYPFWDAVWL